MEVTHRFHLFRLLRRLSFERELTWKGGCRPSKISSVSHHSAPPTRPCHCEPREGSPSAVCVPFQMKCESDTAFLLTVGAFTPAPACFYSRISRVPMVHHILVPLTGHSGGPRASSHPKSALSYRAPTPRTWKLPQELCSSEDKGLHGL